MPDPEMTNAWLGGFGLFVAVTIALLTMTVSVWRRSRRASSVEALAAAQEAARTIEEARPRCICGDVAVAPWPTLKRSRGDWLRSIFAAPPRYRRVVEAMGDPALCRSHAHLADNLLDEFLFGIRAEQSALNASIAIKAAQFEQEGLAKKIGESLTPAQKQATRRSSVASSGLQLVANDKN